MEVAAFVEQEAGHRAAAGFAAPGQATGSVGGSGVLGQWPLLPAFFVIPAPMSMSPLRRSRNPGAHRRRAGSSLHAAPSRVSEPLTRD
jgi:hypothetical protein